LSWSLSADWLLPGPVMLRSASCTPVQRRDAAPCLPNTLSTEFSTIRHEKRISWKFFFEGGSHAQAATQHVPVGRDMCHAHKGEASVPQVPEEQEGGRSGQETLMEYETC
jgi:hypothetical protein